MECDSDSEMPTAGPSNGGKVSLVGFKYQSRFTSSVFSAFTEAFKFEKFYLARAQPQYYLQAKLHCQPAEMLHFAEALLVCPFCTPKC